MGHYKSNVRDLEFNLFEVFGIGRRLGHGPFADLDVADARSILTEVERLAAGPVADSFTDADRHPPVFDPATSSVRLPESFARSFRAYQDAQWWRMGLPEGLGGIAAPMSLRWAIAELILGANPAIHMYSSGPSTAHLLWRIGTPDQQRLAQHIIEHQWTSTMVLTEPDAGSDVGAGRTTAVRQPDGSWHLAGVKRFITSGEHDLSENIVHLVLARPEGHGPGTKGLSMFVVPKFHVDLDSGRLGERNGVYATNVERKMGLKVSTTCELRFGERHPAVGWLVGDVHDGIAQMFMVIEWARMMVGTKAIATLSTGYLNALDFARNRVQGPDLTRQADRGAPRVTIIHHADVRRMLMLQKAYAEGMRALMLFTATHQDAILEAEARGERDESAERLNDLLLPLVKGVGSERYLQDYPIEQYLRDSKIDTLYEGTTSIQGMDLFFRKIVKDRGVALTALLTQVGELASSDTGNGRLKLERAALGRALADVQAMVGTLVNFLTSAAEDARNVYKVGQNTTRLLMSLGDLVIGWLLIRQAAVAQDALDAGVADARDRAFYEGKLAAARFFAGTVLPELSARRAALEATDNVLMDLPEAAF